MSLTADFRFIVQLLQNLLVLKVFSMPVKCNRLIESDACVSLFLLMICTSFNCSLTNLFFSEVFTVGFFYRPDAIPVSQLTVRALTGLLFYSSKMLL